MAKQTKDASNIVQGAIQAIKKEILPATAETHTDTWRTQKFVDIIEDFTHTIIDRDLVVQTLINEGYQYTYIKNVGIEWYIL